MFELFSCKHSVSNPFYSGDASILTFQVEELVATKLRALYQRKKGRDLYDLWLALTVLRLDPEKIIATFPAYRPDGVSGVQMEENLLEKLQSREFCTDVDAMVKTEAPEYDPMDAGALVIERLIRRID